MPEDDMWGMEWYACYMCNRDSTVSDVPCLIMSPVITSSDDNPNSDNIYLEQVRDYEGDLTCPHQQETARFLPITFQQVLAIITDNQRNLVKKGREPESVEEAVIKLHTRFSDLEVV